MSFYKYIKRYSCIGAGAEEYALVRPGIPISPTAFAPRYNIRNELDPRSSMPLAPPKAGPLVDLKANGVYFSGAVEFQGLASDKKLSQG